METIYCLSDYIGKINYIYQDIATRRPSATDAKALFFRGVSQIGHQLLPSAFRGEIERKNPEQACLLNYRDNMPRHSVPYDFIRQRTEILVDMQHHVINTRLLDWSFSPLMALYFAVKDESGGEDSAVWVLDPWLLHRKFLGRPAGVRGIPHDAHVLARALLASHTYEEVMGIIREEFYGCEVTRDDLQLPFPFLGKYGNARLIHQSGGFTIHGGRYGETTAHKPLDHFDELKGDPRLLQKIRIPRKQREGILAELNRLFINPYSVFPDLDGMSQHLKLYPSLYSVRKKSGK